MRSVIKDQPLPRRIIPKVTIAPLENFVTAGEFVMEYVGNPGLRFDRQFDLLALANSGDPSDTIDPALAIEVIYFKVNGIHYAGYIKDETSNCGIVDLTDNTRRVTFDFKYERVYMCPSRPTYFPDVDTSSIPWRIFGFHITGEVKLDTGIIELNAVVDDVPEDLEVELLGYSIGAFYAKRVE